MPKSGLKPPTIKQLKAYRTAMGLTQEEAAAMCGVSLRTWQGYELHGSDRAIPLPVWELFLVNARVNHGIKIRGNNGKYLDEKYRGKI